MNQSEFEKLMADVERERERAIAEADKEYRQNKDALERVRRLTQRYGQSVSVPEQTVENSLHLNASETCNDNEWSQLTIIERARRSLKSVPKEFSVRDVAEIIEKAGAEADRTSLSGALARLAEDGEIVLLERGSGRRPSSYTMPQSPDSQERSDDEVDSYGVNGNAECFSEESGINDTF
ncbi:hypothetical protein [Thalassoroseus pseudoceratinae]|uniref:hypothetical protein n=1 Tax=Thalassoroseus pseudoceratinae TaxID=2713176 RepID=UPI00141F3167|nr:hypothetical protein [Thalassoroseus pseudoceratinae]